MNRAAATVCVTGMHRSGTSFAARALSLLGVSLGDPDQLMPPGPDNQAGYWENRYIKEFNDALLTHLGGSWDRPPVLDDGWEERPDLDEMRDRAARVFDAAFCGVSSDTTIAFKDPRCSLLLPFWRSVRPIAATIILVRAPAEVIASLGRRKQAVAAPQAALLWLRYLFAALSNDPDALILRQDDLQRETASSLRHMTDHIGIAAPDDDVVTRVRADFDESLHHPAPVSDTPRHPVVRLAGQVWNGGDLDVDSMPTSVSHAIRTGCLQGPGDAEELTLARARLMDLQTKIRAQRQELRALRAAMQESVDD